MFGPRIFIPFLFAVIVHMLPPAAAHAQQSTTLPKIRLANETGTRISNMYFCSGADWESCRTRAAAKMRGDMYYSYPEHDNLGGRKVNQGETVDLRGVGSFALFVEKASTWGPASWSMLLVNVKPAAAVPVSGPVPPVVDFDVHTYASSSPAVGFSVSAGKP